MRRIIVAYDISDHRRRRRVAMLLEGYGERVQKSVFECELDSSRENALSAALRSVLDPVEDKLRLYPLCEKDHALSLAWDAKGRLRHRDGWVF